MVAFNLIGIAIGIVLLGGGIVIAWRGFRTYRSANVLARAAPITADTNSGDMTIASGRVTEAAHQGSLQSGYSGHDCVAYSTKRIKQKASAKEDIRRANTFRERIRENHDSMPFVMETPEGPVTVNANGAHIEIDENDYEPVNTHDVVNNRGTIVGLWWLIRDIATTFDRQVRKIYLEFLVRVGDQITVIGEYSETGDTTGAIVNPRDAPMVIASISPDHVVDRFRSAGKQGLFTGTILGALGVGIVLFLTGVL